MGFLVHYTVTVTVHGTEVSVQIALEMEKATFSSYLGISMKGNSLKA